MINFTTSLHAFAFVLSKEEKRSSSIFSSPALFCYCIMDIQSRKTPSGLAPVHFFSHGSTAMLGEQSESADYWKKCGDAALANGIEHVIIMASVVPILVSRLGCF